MRRLMQTIIALPSIASSRCSKCSTRSSAISLMRFSGPTSASSCAHLALELLLALDLLAFGDLLELGVDLGPLALLQLELGQAGSRSRSGRWRRPSTARWMS